MPDAARYVKTPSVDLICDKCGKRIAWVLIYPVEGSLEAAKMSIRWHGANRKTRPRRVFVSYNSHGNGRSDFKVHFDCWHCGRKDIQLKEARIHPEVIAALESGQNALVI